MSFKIFLPFLTILLLTSCATVEKPSEKSLGASIPLSSLPSGTFHVVQRGETLWRISQNYHIDPEEILRANKINDTAVISEGQTIIIPQPIIKKIVTTTNFGPKIYNEDFKWPVKGKIIARFKQKYEDVFNKGIDIATDIAQEIVASRSGQVTFIGKLPGYGLILILDHRDGFSTIYSGESIATVKAGDFIQQGAVIAKSGNPLNKRYCSLHFEVRKQHKPQNPLYYLTD